MRVAYFLANFAVAHKFNKMRGIFEETAVITAPPLTRKGKFNKPDEGTMVPVPFKAHEEAYYKILRPRKATKQRP